VKVKTGHDEKITIINSQPWLWKLNWWASGDWIVSWI